MVTINLKVSRCRDISANSKRKNTSLEVLNDVGMEVSKIREKGLLQSSVGRLCRDGADMPIKP